MTVEGEGAIIWSAWTGAKLRTITRPASCGTCSVAFSPDSKLVAIGSRNYDEGQVTEGPNLCVAEVLIVYYKMAADGLRLGGAGGLLADGKNLVVCCSRLSMQFLDTETGELTREIRGYKLSPNGYWIDFAMAPRARTLVTVVTDNVTAASGFVTVWSIQGRDEANGPRPTPPPTTTGVIPQRLHHFPTSDPVGIIACSPDGKLIAIGNGSPASTALPDIQPDPLTGDFKPSVQILDARTGKTIVSPKLTSTDEDASIGSVERVPSFQVEALAFSPDGGILAVGTSLGQVKLFNARTGELVRVLDDEQARLAVKGIPETWKSFKRAMGGIASLAFSPDGSLLATAGNSFDEAPLPPLGEGKGIDANLAPAHGQVKVWEVETGKLKPGLGGNGCGKAVAFSPDGNLLAGAGTWYVPGELGSGVMIWNLRTGEKIRSIKMRDYGFTRFVAFSPDSRSVIFGTFFHGDGGSSVTWLNVADALSGVQKPYQSMHNWADAKAFWPDGRSIASLHGEYRTYWVNGTQSGEIGLRCDAASIQFFDTGTWTVKHELRPPKDSPQGGRWRDFAIAPQAYMLAIGGTDARKRGFVEVWGPRSNGRADESESTPPPETTGAAPNRVHHFKSAAAVDSIACSPDGKLIAIANGNLWNPLPDDWNRSVTILDAATGKEVVSLKVATDDEETALVATLRPGQRHSLQPGAIRVFARWPCRGGRDGHGAGQTLYAADRRTHPVSGRRTGETGRKRHPGDLQVVQASDGERVFVRILARWKPAGHVRPLVRRL